MKNCSHILAIILVVSISLTSTVAAYNQTVYKAQKTLEELGYSPGPLDGIWGSKTEEAIRKFQRDNGLSVTGKLDDQTKNKLGLHDQIATSKILTGKVVSIDARKGDILVETDSGDTIKICDVYHYFGEVSQYLEVSVSGADFAARLRNFADFKVGDQVEISYRPGHTELDSFKKISDKPKAPEKSIVVQGTIEHCNLDTRELRILKDSGGEENLTIAKNMVVMAGDRKVSASVLKKGMKATVTYVEEKGEPDPRMGVPIIFIAKHVQVDASVTDQSGPAARFVDNTDGTATDTKTKLIWQKADNGAMVTFQEAQAYCKSLKLAGHTDWRLPKKDEKDETVVVQLMMPRHSKEMPADFYWSDDPTVKLAFNFLSSHLSVSNIYGAKEGSRAYVRAVRGITAGTPKQKEGAHGETVRLISAKISELRQGMFSFFKACSVTPYHNFKEENVSVPAGTPADDLVGIAVNFDEEWGGWGSKEEVTKEKTILFRNGMVGKCRAIPAYVKDGTEAKIKRKVYIYKNGQWQVSQ